MLYINCFFPLLSTKSNEVNKNEETANKRPRKQDSVKKVKDFSAEYDGQILDPELFLVETDKEYNVERVHPFDYKMDSIVWLESN